MKIRPKVLIAIVTYNGEKYIKKCIDSISSKNYDLLIYVFDNNSSDKTLEILGKYSNLKVELSHENYGFGKANNVMIKYALENKFDFIYLLNQDTYFLKNSLDNLLAFAIQNSKFAIYSPIHLSRDEEKMDIPFQRYIENETIESSKNSLSHKKFINAAAWLIPIHVLEVVGGFSPLFFHYGEDRDYAYRLIAKGGYFIVAEESLIVHDREIKFIDESQATSRDKIKYMNRANINLIRYAGNINDNLITALLKVTFYGMGEAKKQLVKKQYKLSLGHIKSIFLTFFKITQILSHRKSAKKKNAFL